MLQKFARFLKVFALCLLTFVVVYVGVFYILSIVSSTSNISSELGDGQKLEQNKEQEQDFDTDKVIDIYLSTNGVHTDFVLPLTTDVLDWQTRVAVPSGSIRWLAFGWGDRGFYIDTPTWSDLSVSTALTALSGMGKSAMHVSAYSHMTTGEDVVKLSLTRKEYQTLVHYIDMSFEKVENEYQRIEVEGYGAFDAFYQAKGSYSLFYTCNTWVNQGLKQINQKAALWTLHDQGIFRHYK